jgi:DNA (cytosine-5)-methyltransferase 1
MPATIRAVDLFCGAGGASTGLVRACTALGLDYELTAINHWPVAVATHTENHPGVRHLCESVERVDPREVVPGGRLQLLIAGPECTHFSSARGGRPVNPQSRASAWHILKWAQELYIDTILIENVPEFRTWGPIGANGKPLKSAKGQTYRAFLDALRSLGYKVEDRILNAADYGDPTTRRRLFILARRGRHPMAWPKATHSPTGERTLFGQTKKWRAAREVIDWSLKGKSIFHRKTPLKPATMARILAGLERFGGAELQPFLVVLRQHMGARSLDQPVPTIAAQGQHVGICEFVLGQHGGATLRPADEPLPTIACGGAIRVGEAFLVPMYGERPTQDPRTHSVDAPVPTIPATGGGKIGVVEPVILHTTHGGRARSVDTPLPTVTGANRGELAVVEPCLVQTNERRGERVASVDDPIRTITAVGGRCFGLAEPFLTKYNRTATGAYSVHEPLDTVSTRDRFGLVQPVINGYTLDIRFRMLQPHELAAATSFPRTYVFTGSREDVVKQIGNAWPGEIATALCTSALADVAGRRASGRQEAIA